MTKIAIMTCDNETWTNSFINHAPIPNTQEKGLYNTKLNIKIYKILKDKRWHKIKIFFFFPSCLSNFLAWTLSSDMIIKLE